MPCYTKGHNMNGTHLIGILLLAIGVWVHLHLALPVRYRRFCERRAMRLLAWVRFVTVPKKERTWE